MSIVLGEKAALRSGWMRSVRDWLRQARAALSVPGRQDADGLAGRYPTDVGMGSAHIARAVERETMRLELLNVGWRQSPGRRPNG